MEKIDPKEYQKRLDRMTELFSDMVRHADKLSTCRCPYKNRHNQCTAPFGCRNKRKPEQIGELPRCAGDDKLNYRAAWEA
jgi:hypothetical protein